MRKNLLMKRLTCIALLTSLTFQSFTVTGSGSKASAATSDKKNLKYFNSEEDKSYLKPKTFTLSAAGDVTLSSDIKQPASVNFFSIYNKQKPDYFFRSKHYNKYDPKCHIVDGEKVHSPQHRFATA